MFFLGATERTQDSVQVREAQYKQGLVLSAPSGHPSEDLSVSPRTRRSYYRNKQPLLYKIVPPELFVGPRASVVSIAHSRPGQSLLGPLQSMFMLSHLPEVPVIVCMDIGTTQPYKFHIKSSFLLQGIHIGLLGMLQQRTTDWEA